MKKAVKQTRKPRRKKPNQSRSWADDDAARLAAGRDPRQLHFDFYLVLGEPNDQQRKADLRWSVIQRFRLPALSVSVTGMQRRHTKRCPTLAGIADAKKKTKRTRPAVGK
jgi:hypothetical protein